MPAALLVLILGYCQLTRRSRQDVSSREESAPISDDRSWVDVGGYRLAYEVAGSGNRRSCSRPATAGPRRRPALR
jgi:hypothetical protein